MNNNTVIKNNTKSKKFMIAFHYIKTSLSHIYSNIDTRKT